MWKQNRNCNVNVWTPGRGGNGSNYIGWCLGYVGDAFDIPNANRVGFATAKIAADHEAKLGNLQANQNFPNGVYVVGFMNLTKVPAGHIFIAKNDNGKLTIWDSDWRSGVRKTPYSSVAEINAWFSNFGPSFRGWSRFLENVELARFIELPKPDPKPQPGEDKIEYIYKPGDTFGQVILNLGLNTKYGLWGPDGDVTYYTKQLVEQGALDTNGNIIVGKKIILTKRKG